MKRIILLTMLLAITGCISETPYGKCIGIADDKDPKLQYKLSINNAVVGIIFIELVYPPIKILVDETYCPVGVKPT